ncbi:YbaB/EbfC family nucleoid-associated protein [Amycolatopsis circi]|uniref:YbaB/EbfC family nucleoid-associated protein n=1 Tax=Amycolatopsis circi TaxID=871959 RepID=UPI000E238026|nr:YbaB/EbfC family nucleoid-associated protein [Amycolatopsis circi]
MNALSPEIAEIRQRAAEAQERLKHVSATATSQDGAVTATVNTAGALQELQFGSRADEMPRAALAAAVLATARRAQAQAAQQLTAIMAPVIGEHSDAMKFLEEQIPEPEVPEEPAPPSTPQPQFFDAQDDSAAPPPVRPAAPPAPPARPARPAADPTDDDDYYSGGSFLGRN